MDTYHVTGHGLSLLAIVGAILGMIPALAAVLAVIFYVIQIWESKTVREWLKKRRLAKLHSLRNKIMVLEHKSKD